MDIIKKISENNYSKEVTNNGVLNIQNLKDIYKGEGTFIGKYLHTIYPGLESDGFAQLEKETKISLNKTYIEFLTKCNGINLFSDSLNIYGFGKVLINGSYQVTRDPANPLPFDLLTENNGKINESEIKIGSICENGLFLENKTGKITRVNKKSCIVENWNSLDECLDDLYKRLAKCYDINGFCKESNIIGKLVFNKIKNI